MDQIGSGTWLWVHIGPANMVLLVLVNYRDRRFTSSKKWKVYQRSRSFTSTEFTVYSWPYTYTAASKNSMSAIFMAAKVFNIICPESTWNLPCCPTADSSLT